MSLDDYMNELNGVRGTFFVFAYRSIYSLDFYNNSIIILELIDILPCYDAVVATAIASCCW